jgi:hypothetical protein
MNNSKIASQIRYVTNVDGETTDVLVPIELWQHLMSSVNILPVNVFFLDLPIHC